MYNFQDTKWDFMIVSWQVSSSNHSSSSIVQKKTDTSIYCKNQVLYNGNIYMVKKSKTS